MPAFGENLRREREMRGVSLEEISSATKISLRFLDAIEREDFSKLPGGIFSRSFVRTYAHYLGLDEDRAVAEFQLAAKPQVDFDLHRMTGGGSSVVRPGARTPLISALVVLVLLGGGYWLSRYTPRTTEAPPPAPVVTSPPVAPPAVPNPTASGETSALPGVNPASGEVAPGAAPGSPAATSPGANPIPHTGPAAGGNPAAQSTPPTGAPAGSKPAADTDLVLQVAATERAWVAVDADGKTVLQRVLNPDEVQTVKAHRSFDVTTGNAQSIILTLNGETLKPLGRHGEVKSVHLTRDDLKNSTP